ncbi:hyccin-like isoform X1 [Patiria miniata]|uniref:Hyccin n=1 Tax=Patiria miniata TaxID=46514 RepID=A0A913ZAF1_PATMI|nr:hyccin-like isoform X1 [Patiria miniata]
MAERIVQDWLTEYKATDLATFSRRIKDDIQLIKSIFEILQEPHSNLQEPVCGQLYEFYRSGHFELKRFCLQFVPAVIWIYLYGLALHKNYGRAESLLLGIYNMEVVEPDGISKVESFTVPTLAKSSIYHEPVSQLALTENVLSYQQSDHRLVTRGPLCQINALTIKNRFSVLTHVVSEYNADIGFLSPVSHAFFCKICSSLVLCGFSGTQLAWKQSSSVDRISKHKLMLDIYKTPRIPLDSVFLLEMLTGIYFVMFNGQASAGMQALEDIHFRANYELYADVLLVSNAIKHSLDTNPSGRPSDGPVGINVAVTPPSPVVKRSAITNASFKTRRQKVMLKCSFMDRYEQISIIVCKYCVHVKQVCRSPRAHHGRKETTITVTIEGVEKTEAVTKTDGLNTQESSTTEPATVLTSTKLSYHGKKQRHSEKGISAVDVAVTDKSGSKRMETVEMEEVRLTLDARVAKQTNKDAGDRYFSEGSLSYPEISPASHSRELHAANQHSSNSSGESFETNL